MTRVEVTRGTIRTKQADWRHNSSLSARRNTESLATVTVPWTVALYIRCRIHKHCQLSNLGYRLGKIQRSSGSSTLSGQTFGNILARYAAYLELKMHVR